MPLNAVYKDHKSTLIIIHQQLLHILSFTLKKDLIIMKVLILACLVAFALAKEKEDVSVFSETAESVSSSEENITGMKKQKLEKFKIQEQQQKEDESQDKIHSFFQSQPFVYPFAEPIPYTVFSQNALPLAQASVMLPFFSPEIVEASKAKETTFSKHKMMPFFKSSFVPSFESQILNFTDLKNLHLPLPLTLPQLQALMHQMAQALPQTPMFTPQTLQPFFQPTVQAIPQQVMSTPQKYMSLQALHLNQQPLLDQTHHFYPATQPYTPAYNFFMV